MARKLPALLATLQIEQAALDTVLEQLPETASGGALATVRSLLEHGLEDQGTHG